MHKHASLSLSCNEPLCMFLLTLPLKCASLIIWWYIHTDSLPQRYITDLNSEAKGSFGHPK